MYLSDIAHDSQKVFITNPLLLVVICYKLSIIVNQLQQQEMIFLREHFNTKHRKLNTNDFASKAKSCQRFGKKLVY